MTDDKIWQKLELIDLLKERSLSLFERRRRRLIAAQARLKEARIALATAIQKDRNGADLSGDEYIVTHLGFLPGERAPLEATAAVTADANPVPVLAG